MDMVKVKGTINTEKCIIIAKLLEEEGNILEIQGELDYSFYINQKSLSLFLNAYLNKRESCELESYFSDIDPLIEKICQYKLTCELQDKIIKYYIRCHIYDKAENTVYELLQENNYNVRSLKYAIKFYEDLLSKDNDELSAGKLPRNEIMDSMSSLKSKLQNSSSK